MAPVLAVTIWGLLARRGWAPWVARILLWWIAIAGVLDSAVALARGRIELPLGAAVALVVLWGRPRRVGRLPSGGRALLAACVLSVLLPVAIAMPALVGVALAPGASPFSVGADALELTVAADCGPAAASPGPDGGRITVTARWHWRQQEWMSGGHDGLLIAWSAHDGRTVAGFSMPSGVETDVLPPAEEPIERAADVEDRARTFAIHVDDIGQRDGEVRLVLANRHWPPADLTVMAAYAHLDRWLVTTPDVACASAG
jgi:hypothetical protein